MDLLETVIRHIIREAKSSKSTFMIALYPTAESVADIVEYRNKISKFHDLSSMKEILPEDLHATIRWWEAEHGNYHKIIADLSGFELIEPISAKVTDVDILGDSLSIMLSSKDMQNLFQKVDNLVQGHGGPPSIYPNYNPHVALFYGDWDKVVVDQVTESPDFSIVFDRIKMVDNSDNIYLNKKFENIENT